MARDTPRSQRTLWPPLTPTPSSAANAVPCPPPANRRGWYGVVCTCVCCPMVYRGVWVWCGVYGYGVCVVCVRVSLPLDPWHFFHTFYVILFPIVFVHLGVALPTFSSQGSFPCPARGCLGNTRLLSCRPLQLLSFFLFPVLELLCFQARDTSSYQFVTRPQASHRWRLGMLGLCHIVLPTATS